MTRKSGCWIAAMFALVAWGTAGADEVFPVVHSETITVKVLDGKSGRPQPRLHIVLIGGYNRLDLQKELWREEALTDAGGMVHLSRQLSNLPFFRVQVLKRHSCQPDEGNASFSLEQIRRDGQSSANRCGLATAAEAPGVFTFFVKAKKESGPERSLPPELSLPPARP